MMRSVLIAAFLLPQVAWACDQLVCRVDPNGLTLPEIITFDDTRSGWGPGFEVRDVLTLPGAKFGERFAGQVLFAEGNHDRVEGAAHGPLQVLPGANGENLSVVVMSRNSVLNGYGPAGFPTRDGQGEGAIAVLFDEDQAALAFDLRGGEAGAATVQFLRRNGDVLAIVPVSPLSEFTVGFARTGDIQDIAGFVVTNSDPQGLAIDTIRFGRLPGLS